ncbi:MAG: segregation/condensation protein A [Planctomycetota bacterium]
MISRNDGDLGRSNAEGAGRSRPSEQSPSRQSPSRLGEEAASPAFRPQLPSFSGPLDLLLYLIHKNEVDIFDIPIAQVLQQYLEHLQVLERNGLLNLNDAGEFLVMAARLMEIKSRMLLPSPELIGDGELLEEELTDPRLLLVEQLLEYRETKERALLLEENHRERSRRFDRSPVDLPAPPPNTVNLQESTIWDLCAAFQKLLDEARARDSVHLLKADELPQEQAIARIRGFLESTESGRVPFRDLFHPELGYSVLVAYFLAILEMARMQLLWIAQEKDFGEIHLVRREIP